MSFDLLKAHWLELRKFNLLLQTVFVERLISDCLNLLYEIAPSLEKSILNHLLEN